MRLFLASLLTLLVSLGCGASEQDAQPLELEPEPALAPETPTLRLPSARHTEPLQAPRHVVVIEDDLFLLDSAPSTIRRDDALSVEAPAGQAASTLEQVREQLAEAEPPSEGGGLGGGPVGSFGFGIGTSPDPAAPPPPREPPPRDPPRPLDRATARAIATARIESTEPAIFFDRDARVGRVVGVVRTLAREHALFCPSLAVTHEDAVATVPVLFCAGRLGGEPLLRVTAELRDDGVVAALTALRERTPATRVRVILVAHPDLPLQRALEVRDLAIDAGVFPQVRLAVIPWSVLPAEE